MNPLYDLNSPEGRTFKTRRRTRVLLTMKAGDQELPENLILGLNPHILDLAVSGVFDGKLPLNSTTLIPCPVGCCCGRKLRVHKIGTRIYVSLYDISTGRLLLRFHPSVVDLDETEGAAA